ncbi:MAG: phosphotransferase [Cyanobacteria bacterium J06621_15]
MMCNLKNYCFSEADVVELLSQWSIKNPKVQSTNQGTVNKTFFVETYNHKDKFVFKLYDNSTTTEQIKYEHSLLTFLQSCDLSFNVPAPIPIDSGETLLITNQNNSSLKFSLQKYISGQPANRQNLNHIFVAGQALGELHRALISFDSQGNLAKLPRWGELNKIHPLIKNPLEVPQLLNLEKPQQQRLIKILREVIEIAPNLYENLQLQITHADYLCPNVLIKDNRVNGVIDFEFATYDLRLLDFIAALDHFSRIGNETPVWERIEAFIKGYKKYNSLSNSEIEALISTWKLQQANCIVYWTGWLLEEKVTYESVLNGVIKIFLLEDWLKDKNINLLELF